MFLATVLKDIEHFKTHFITKLLYQIFMVNKFKVAASFYTPVSGMEESLSPGSFPDNLCLCLSLQHIWGSYWKEGRWGYKCCHSFFKYSYCTGEAGKESVVSITL